MPYLSEKNILLWDCIYELQRGEFYRNGLILENTLISLASCRELEKKFGSILYLPLKYEASLAYLIFTDRRNSGIKLFIKLSAYFPKWQLLF